MPLPNYFISFSHNFNTWKFVIKKKIVKNACFVIFIWLGSEAPAFRPKPVWKTPKGHVNLEVFLSRLENELFSDDMSPHKAIFCWIMECLERFSSWKTIAINGGDKGSSVVVWDSSDYFHEASRQLQHQNIYKDVKFN